MAERRYRVEYKVRGRVWREWARDYTNAELAIAERQCREHLAPQHPRIRFVETDTGRVVQEIDA